MTWGVYFQLTLYTISPIVIECATELSSLEDSRSFHISVIFTSGIYLQECLLRDRVECEEHVALRI